MAITSTIETGHEAAGDSPSTSLQDASESPPGIDDALQRLSRLERRVAREKLARKAAEELLEQKSLELFEVNQSLEMLNAELEDRVRVRTQELEDARKRAVLVSQQDHLTELANRAYLSDRMNDLVDAGARFSLVLIDLDDFKQINDTHGHAAGDAVLKTVADRLVQTVPDNSLVARLGGDEFAILIFGDDRKPLLELILAQLASAIGQPTQFSSTTLLCGASIGYAHFPDHAATAEELQVNADLAMYEAKFGNEQPFVGFYPELAISHRRRKQLARDLQSALQADALSTFYQPVISLDEDGRVDCEVLLRWQHPEKGWIDPEETVAIAQEAGLLGRLTRFVIRNAIAELADLVHSQALSHLAINLTAYDLRDETLSAYIVDVCRENHVDPKSVKFEITEQTVVTDTPSARATMERLNRHGFCFAIDDFGTGYSNLQTLHQLPFSVLKIDRPFITNLAHSSDAETIVQAMIDLAHRLQLKVVAEGIETPEQQQRLKAIGCDFGQGYWLGRPQCIDDFRERVLGEAASSSHRDPDLQRASA